MKKNNQQPNKFWQSLEGYLYQKIKIAPVSWGWGGMGIMGAVIGVSIIGGYGDSPTLSGQTVQIIEEAARQGDYQTAEILYETAGGVLGDATELEERVYPIKAIEKKISSLEETLQEYPESKDIYLLLENLYSQIENGEMARYYHEKARILDPNGNEFQ